MVSFFVIVDVKDDIIDSTTGGGHVTRLHSGHRNTSLSSEPCVCRRSCVHVSYVIVVYEVYHSLSYFHSVKCEQYS